MKKLRYAVILLLGMSMAIMASCTKDPNNGDNGGNNGGGANGGGGYNGGGHYNGNYEYVDLGLPSGTLWATFNLGADAPEGYGDYFAWGETQPKRTYSWSNYKFYKGTIWSEEWGGNVYLFTKYCCNPLFGYEGFTDTLTTLLPEDDAATVKWGSEWRMPTLEECKEL